MSVFGIPARDPSYSYIWSSPSRDVILKSTLQLSEGRFAADGITRSTKCDRDQIDT